MRARPIPVWLLLALVCAGCDPGFDAELLEVRAVEPERLEPGVTLAVRGAGFPAGRDARVALVGTLRRPGRRPTPVDVRTEGHAAGSDLVEVAVDEALLSRVGGRGTFEGQVRVLFEAADPEGTVSGTLRDVQLAFAPGAARRLPVQAANAREAREVLARIGVELEPEAPTGDGLLVGRVAPGSAADEAGLVAGDRIEAVDGVRIEAIADFIPSPGARRAELRVHRPDHARTFVTDVQVRSSSGGPGGSLSPWLLLALAVLAWLLLFLAPSARITARLTRRLTAPRVAATATNDERGRWARLQRWAWRAFEMGLDAAALALVPLCIRGLGGDLDVGVLLVTSLAARLVAVVASRHPRERPTPAVMRFLGGGLPSAAALGTAVVLSGSVRLDGLVQAQGPWPWQWLAFHNPLAFLLLPALVAATVGAPSRRAGGVPTPVAAAAERAGRWIATTTAVAPFLGGWGPADWPLWAAVLAFVGKGMAVLWVGARLREVERPRVGAVVISVACVAGSVAWLLAAVPPVVGAIAGPILAGSALAVTGWVVFEVVRRRARPPAHAEADTAQATMFL